MSIKQSLSHEEGLTEDVVTTSNDELYMHIMGSSAFSRSDLVRLMITSLHGMGYR